MTIKLNSIIPAPWNTRGEITPKSVSELALSIGENGLINPITVWKCNTDKNHWLQWMCIAGNRRLSALKLLHGPNEHLNNLTEGKDFIVFFGTETEAKMVTVTENLQREDVSPIEEAALVAECLDAGMTAEAIAAKTGRSASWVNRRRRLIGLCDAFKSVADKFTTDQLEKIASFDTSVQKRVAEYYDADSDDWDRVKCLLNNESKDLANAKFDTASCHECLKRTGAQADLWGVCDGCLGRCQDKDCFEQKVKDAHEEKIAELTRGAKEIVRVNKYWQMPVDSESSPKKSKQHPCAYVGFDLNGEIIVRWGESKKDKDEREKKEQERREAERAEKRAASEREDGIVGSLNAWTECIGGGGGCCVGLDGLIKEEVGSRLNGNVGKFVMWAVKEMINTWQTTEKWAQILRAFPGIAQLAGVSDEDAEYLVGEYAEDGED